MGSCWGGVKKDSDRVVNRILIIDDEDDFRQVIIKLLTRQGFEVVAASDGKSGVSLAAETLPDLIVCDLNMPGMDGYEVLVALRQWSEEFSFSPGACATLLVDRDQGRPVRKLELRARDGRLLGIGDTEIRANPAAKRRQRSLA